MLKKNTNRIEGPGPPGYASDTDAHKWLKNMAQVEVFALNSCVCIHSHTLYTNTDVYIQHVVLYSYLSCLPLLNKTSTQC